MEPITATLPLIAALSVATWHYDNSYTVTLHTYTDMELAPPNHQDQLHPLANTDGRGYSLCG